ncbi:inhibitor of Bruton tyrosine kinase-like [Asterias amurensis]|uniref:inhibitor of Bruton tyrosine kinase-like n=1 Tax=Asterias amurensis TaxID=7602 RepID=UPI003AB2131F
MTNTKLDSDCTPRCRSTKCAANLISVITRGTTHQIKCYFNTCQNASHVSDRFGRNALHMAASCGKFEIVDWLLLEKHASLSAEDLESGWTALHRSIFHGQVIAAVYLIHHGASLEKHDNENLTALELAMKDHPKYAQYDLHGPSQVYTWGSNANFTLGHGRGQSRSQPDIVDQLKKDEQSIKQAVMCKFHTVFLSQCGRVYTCGLGQGGRLGHNNEEVCLKPHPVNAMEKKVCETVAAARDHTMFLLDDGTVYSCGQNSHHQLGHSSLGVKALTPKLISSKQLKNKSIVGVAAGRFHSVMYTKDALFTFGLNAGQLGHVKGEKYIVSPRHVTTLHHDKVHLIHVTTSDAATVCATLAGDIYVLNEYQCRKVASKQLNLLKVVACGGSLDSDLGEGSIEKHGGTELILLVLNQSGLVHSWRSSSRTLKRCMWNRKRQVYMSDIALSSQGVLFCTEDGEAFSGRFLLKKKLTSPSNTKDTTQHAITPQHPASPPPMGETISPFKDWSGNPEETERVSLNRLPVVHRATRVACEPNGLNFAVIQADPKASLTEVPTVGPSMIVKHMSQLLAEGDPTDPIHDVIIKVGHKTIAAHKYILALRSDYFRRLFLQTPPSNTTPSNTMAVLPDEVHNVSDKTDFQTLTHLLQYIYTDTCDVFSPGYPHNTPGVSLTSSGFNVSDDFGNLTLNDHNRNRSAFGVYREEREKGGRKDGRKDGGKKTKKGGKKSDEIDAMVPVRNLIEVAKKFGVGSLVKRLDQVKYRDGRLQNFRPSSKRLGFNRRQLSQLVDVVLSSEEGILFPCHKCILVARLEYFQGMLGSGWIEASSSDPLKMPIPSAILSIILEYIYTNDAPMVRSCTDIELLCNTLTLSDQLLIGRLKEICEVALVDLISLRNVAELLEFASLHRAEQLKKTCHQYIGLNLPCLLEARALEVLSNDVLLELTKSYKEMIPSMPYRIITPYQDAPDITYIQEEPSINNNSSTNVKGQEVSDMITFDQGNFDEIISKAKARRKIGRRTSTGKRKSLSFSDSKDNLDVAALPDVIPRTVAMETDDFLKEMDLSEDGASLLKPNSIPSSDSFQDGVSKTEQKETQKSSMDTIQPSTPELQTGVTQSPEGQWVRKERSEVITVKRTTSFSMDFDENQQKGWQSPSMPDVTGVDLRTIMQSEASLSTSPRKIPSSQRVNAHVAKKSQKQRKKDSERAADSVTSPTIPSPVEEKKSVCPWGRTPVSSSSSTSFRELQVEEQKLIGSASSVTMATSPPSKSRKVAQQFSFGIVTHTRQASESDHITSDIASPLEAIHVEVPENPWNLGASSPPASQVSFSEIIKKENEQQESLTKTLKKPFSLIQIEEKALEELRAFYCTQDNMDEFITVERASKVIATPLWKKDQDNS